MKKEKWNDWKAFKRWAVSQRFLIIIGLTIAGIICDYIFHPINIPLFAVTSFFAVLTTFIIVKKYRIGDRQ